MAMDEDKKDTSIVKPPLPIANDLGQEYGFYEIKPHPVPTDDSLLAGGQKRPGFSETFKAGVRSDNNLINTAFKVDNELRSLFEYFDPERQGTFDPLDPKLLNQASPEDWPELVLSRTPEEFYRRLTFREQERKAREDSINGTLSGNLAAGLFNGVTDLTTLIPIASGIRSAKLGYSFISGFANALPATFMASAMSEANLMWAKETHTVDEAIKNTLVQTAFGGLVGGVIGTFRTLKANTYKKMISESVSGKEVKFSIDSKGEIDGFHIYDDAAGAESVSKVWYEDNQIYGFTKDGKMSVASPFFWMAGKWAKNPVVMGMMSPFPSASKFTLDMLETNFDIVKSVVSGKYKPQAMQTLLRVHQANAIRSQVDIANGYFEYLGLPSGQTGRNVIRKALNKDATKLKWESYSRELQLAMSAGGEHSDAFIAKESKRIYEKYYKPYSDKLVELGILAPNYTPFGSVQYLNRLYDRPHITANRPRVTQFLKGEFAATNDKITRAMSRVNDLQERINLTKALMADAAGENKKVLETELTGLTKSLTAENKRINNKLRQGKFSPDMLVGKPGMPLEEVNQLKNLRKPIMQQRKVIKKLEEEYRVASRKTGKEAAAALQERIKAEKEKLKIMREEVVAKYESGKIPEKFVFKDGDGYYYLRKPDRGTYKLRKILDDSELDTAAKNAIDNMLGLSDYAITNGIYDGIKLGSNGENPLAQRTLFIADEKLYKNNLLIKDVRKNISAFIDRAGRIVEMEEYLRRNGFKGDKSPVDWIADKIKFDYEVSYNKLVSSYESKIANASPADAAKLEKAQQKDLNKLNTQLENDVNLSSLIYARVTGGYNYSAKDADLIQVSRFLNNWGYASQLGALVISALQDAVAPIFRNGPINFINDGVLPYFKNFLKGDWKANSLLKQNAGDMAFGIENALAKLNLSMRIGDDFELPLNAATRVSGDLAKGMGIINFANFWSDMWTTVSHTASSSRILRDLESLANGTISKNKKLQLAVIGLDNEILAKKIVRQYKGSGAQKVSGAYVANSHLWDDYDSKKIYDAAVMQEVRSTIFSGKDIASYPAWFENPNGLSSSFMIYMGWMFNATANYTLPLLQRFDPNKVMGVMAMVSVAMLQDPLRKISRGEDPELDKDPFEIFKLGVLNSGTLGIFADTFNKMNAAFDIMPELAVDRYKGKGMGLVLGVPMSFLDTVGTFTGMAATQEWNKSDWKKVGRGMPLINVLWFRKQVNDFIESLNIPKTRAKAKKLKD